MFNYLSPYRIMWLFVMFDLPTNTKKERKDASNFRTKLLDLGFEMSQYSIYMKYCASTEKAEAIGQKIQSLLPPKGKVDILVITDKQFANMKRFYASTQKKIDAKPKQLHIF